MAGEVEAGLPEPDRHKLGSLLAEAEDAIFARLQEIDGKPDPERDGSPRRFPSCDGCRLRS